MVRQPVLGKYLATRKQLVKKLPLDSHVIFLLSIIMTSRTEFLTVPANIAIILQNM
ncbi:hypothetical protein MPLDJ20_20097 [Mesorhizobium plurifarium]|uniref:Uncharacterized protein n=1 Tax=Mesorhizobium plurifarium TaxID=69974 RepID=A0A090F0M5_MESPL|nr:hypothetical protein MPLDJ20_20097 [Mesorhizobium plurifarium]